MNAFIHPSSFILYSFPLTLFENAAEDFAGGRFRNLLDELDEAYLLVRRDARGDEALDLLFGPPLPLSTTNAFGTSPASSSGLGMTAASATEGCVNSSASSSAGAT